MVDRPDAPWKGASEPDYMPRLRRHFADSLPDRLAVADGALDHLSDSEYRSVPGDVPAARAIHLFGHSLAGTGASLGVGHLGELGRELADLTREWEKNPGAPDPASLGQARALVERIRAAAVEFRGWVAEDATD